MPKRYENRANHNKDFLESIINDYPKQYYDWKVTIQFYIALHRCYCVLLSKGYPVEHNHGSNIKNVKEIDSEISRKLYDLYRYSRQSRYDGFLTEDAMLRINEINHRNATSRLSHIESQCLKYYPNLVA